MESPIIPRIATPFGAGLGRSGMLCGAVSGALMAIGLLRGRDRAGDDVRPAYDAARSLIARFRERFGEVECRALTGYDLSKVAQRRLMVLHKVKEKSCRTYLEWAVDEITPLLP